MTSVGPASTMRPGSFSGRQEESALLRDALGPAAWLVRGRSRPVTSWAISTMVSSTRPGRGGVERGSRARPMSRTDGRTARARGNAQPLVCWPPDNSPPNAIFRRIAPHLVPQASALVSISSTRSSGVGHFGSSRTGDPTARCHRSTWPGTGVGFLEDHADAGTWWPWARWVGAVDVHPVECSTDPARLGTGNGPRGIRLRMRRRNVDFPPSRRSDEMVAGDERVLSINNDRLGRAPRADPRTRQQDSVGLQPGPARSGLGARCGRTMVLG